MDTRAPELLIPQLLLSSESEAVTEWLTATPECSWACVTGQAGFRESEWGRGAVSLLLLCAPVTAAGMQAAVAEVMAHSVLQRHFAYDAVIFSTLLPAHTRTPHSTWFNSSATKISLLEIRHLRRSWLLDEALLWLRGSTDLNLHWRRQTASTRGNEASPYLSFRTGMSKAFTPHLPQVLGKVIHSFSSATQNFITLHQQTDSWTGDSLSWDRWHHSALVGSKFVPITPGCALSPYRHC